MHDLDKAELLSAWLEGTLSDTQRIEFERLCIEDKEFAQSVEATNNIAMQAHDYQNARVPDWNREATFTASEQPKWWQMQWLPVTSMAMSVLAIAMVISGFQIRTHDGEMTISFNQFADSQKVEQLVAARLTEFKAEQQQVLSTYAQTLQQQQLDASTQLTNYLLASSRQERREDFGEFIKFINDQRNEDQIYYAKQLNKLQQDMYTNPTDAKWVPTPSIGDVNE